MAFRASPSWSSKASLKVTPSPLLYNLVVEPFLCTLRRDLHGLPLPGSSFQVSAFADDVAVGLAHDLDRQTLLLTIGLHERACNAKLNIDKSEFLFLSPASMEVIHPIGKVMDRNTVFVHLGIPFHPQALPLPESYFNSQLERIQLTITSW